MHIQHLKTMFLPAYIYLLFKGSQITLSVETPFLFLEDEWVSQYIFLP